MRRAVLPSALLTDSSALASQGVLDQAVGAACVAGLIALLIEHQLANAAGGRYRGIARTSAVAIAPLLLVAGAVIASRLTGVDPGP